MNEPEYQEKQLILAVFLFFKKNFWLLFAVGFIGGVLGYFASKQLSAPYSYSAKVCSEIVQSELLNNSFTTLKKIIKNREFEVLSSSLNISLEQAKSLKGLSTSIQISETNKYNKDRRLFGENCIDLSVTFKDTVNYKHTLASIDDFLNNDVNFESLRMSNFSGDKELMKYLNQKILELDSVHKIVLSNARKLPDFQLGFEDAMQIGIERQKLYQKMGYTSKVALFTNGNMVIVKEIRRGLNYAVAGAFSLFFLTLMVLLLKELNQLTLVSERNTE